ncbi:MAG: hypothetical protein AAFY81_03820 [Pseudomonadota bacterium]
MPDLTDKDRFDVLAEQIQREDMLYQSRSNFLVVLNAALAAAAVGLLTDKLYLIGLGVAVFAIVLNFTMNNLILDGKKQQHYLRVYFYEHFSETDFPRPFWAQTRESALKSPKQVSRIVYLMLAGWVGYVTAALYLQINNQ